MKNQLFWLSKQNESLQIEAFKKAFELFRAQHKENFERAQAFKISLEQACEKIHDDLTSIAKDTNLERSSKKTKLLQTQKRKTKTEICKIKFEKLIQKLRSADMSFRDISAYLQKNHKFNISFSALQKNFGGQSENK